MTARRLNYDALRSSSLEAGRRERSSYNLDPRPLEWRPVKEYLHFHGRGALSLYGTSDCCLVDKTLGKDDLCCRLRDSQGSRDTICCVTASDRSSVVRLGSRSTCKSRSRYCAQPSLNPEMHADLQPQQTAQVLRESRGGSQTKHQIANPAN
jgi:hypothetical protein